MAEEAQTRVQNAISNIVSEVDLFALRKMQQAMHLCAAKCCESRSASIDDVHRCVDTCSVPLTQAQNYVQNELSQFQERLQRGILTCQDQIKAKLTPSTTESEVARYRGEFEACAIDCVNKHVDQLPKLLTKMKDVLSKQSF